MEINAFPKHTRMHTHACKEKSLELVVLTLFLELVQLMTCQASLRDWLCDTVFLPSTFLAPLLPAWLTMAQGL